MGAQPPGPGVGAVGGESAFYQAVEDAFCRLRGTPFLFSPKDFHLLRSWWLAQVPLAAILAGLGEVFARKAGEGGEAVASLYYCRHAVQRHARRLATARVGAENGEESPDPAARLAELAAMVIDVAGRWRHWPPLARALGDLGAAVASVPVSALPAEVDATLAHLEQGVLTGLSSLLPDEMRQRLEDDVSRQLAGMDLEDEVGRRTRAAVRLREIREAVGLPRLELG